MALALSHTKYLLFVTLVIPYEKAYYLVQQHHTSGGTNQLKDKSSYRASVLNIEKRAHGVSQRAGACAGGVVDSLLSDEKRRVRQPL